MCHSDQLVHEEQTRGTYLVVCFLAGTTDITVFVLVFLPIVGDDKYYVLPYFWLPEETLDLRVRRDHVPYDIRRKGIIETSVYDERGLILL